MTESILEALRRMSENDSDGPPDPAGQPHEKKSDRSFLAALQVVRKIVRRKRSSPAKEDTSDLEQGIVLRLLNWRNKYSERSEKMSEGDWKSFAARTAFNETNRQFSSPAHRDVPLEAATEVAAEKAVEGETRVEIESLVSVVWQEICQISLRQRRALLLHSQELIVYFLQSGVSDRQLAQILELADDDWLEIKITLPLSDARIARLSDMNQTERSAESFVRSIKKARHEARGRLRRLMEK